MLKTELNFLSRWWLFKDRKVVHKICNVEIEMHWEGLVILKFMLTSFSKKPERSRHEDIPINWNALRRVGDPESSASFGYHHGNSFRLQEKNKKERVKGWKGESIIPLHGWKRLHCQHIHPHLQDLLEHSPS